eukprot:893092-Lingulodinium_polyedra.AAC.1
MVEGGGPRRDLTGGVGSHAHPGVAACGRRLGAGSPLTGGVGSHAHPGRGRPALAVDLTWGVGSYANQGVRPRGGGLAAHRCA